MVKVQDRERERKSVINTEKARDSRRERQRAREGKADGVYGEITAGKGRVSVRVRDSGRRTQGKRWGARSGER